MRTTARRPASRRSRGRRVLGRREPRLLQTRASTSGHSTSSGSPLPSRPGCGGSVSVIGCVFGVRDQVAESFEHVRTFRCGWVGVRDARHRDDQDDRQALHPRSVALRRLPCWQRSVAFCIDTAALRHASAITCRSSALVALLAGVELLLRQLDDATRPRAGVLVGVRARTVRRDRSDQARRILCPSCRPRCRARPGSARRARPAAARHGGSRPRKTMTSPSHFWQKSLGSAGRMR